MDVFPKFIIEQDSEEGLVMIVGKCTYHKQLAHDEKNIRGGGWWSLDREKSVFTLFGESHDFGKAKLDDIISCVKNKKVYSSKTLVRCFSDDYKFIYKDESGEIINLEL